MTPDLPAMSGGLRVIYGLVEHLNELGFHACVWHGTPGHRYESFSSRAPVVTGRSVHLAEGDVVVMPEVGGAKWADLNPEVPTVMLVQGVDFLFADAGFTTPTQHPYPGWPQAAAAITVSETIAEFLAGVLPEGFPLFRVPLEIDTQLYRPGVKEPRIAFMPRRRREDLLSVVHLLHRRGAFAREWDLLPIDNMSVEQVAEAMGRAAIFLNAGEREGFGLPGAEALAAGCHVIGFSGHGGREYMLPEFSEIIPESDVVAMAASVEKAMAEFSQQPSAYAERSAAGRAFIIDRFGRESQATALRAAFGALTAPDSPVLVMRPTEALHFQSRAPQGAAQRGYVALRSMAGSLRRRWFGSTGAS